MQLQLFAEVGIGFTVTVQPVDEAAGAIVVEVSVLSGTLQRSVEISYKTVESTLGNAAASEFMRK